MVSETKQRAFLVPKFEIKQEIDDDECLTQAEPQQDEAQQYQKPIFRKVKMEPKDCIEEDPVPSNPFSSVMRKSTRPTPKQNVEEKNGAYPTDETFESDLNLFEDSDQENCCEDFEDQDETSTSEATAISSGLLSLGEESDDEEQPSMPTMEPCVRCYKCDGAAMLSNCVPEKDLLNNVYFRCLGCPMRTSLFNRLYNNKDVDSQNRKQTNEELPVPNYSYQGPLRVVEVDDGTMNEDNGETAANKLREDGELTECEEEEGTLESQKLESLSRDGENCSSRRSSEPSSGASDDITKTRELKRRMSGEEEGVNDEKRKRRSGDDESRIPAAYKQKSPRSRSPRSENDSSPHSHRSHRSSGSSQRRSREEPLSPKTRRIRNELDPSQFAVWSRITRNSTVDNDSEPNYSTAVEWKEIFLHHDPCSEEASCSISVPPTVYDQLTTIETKMYLSPKKEEQHEQCSFTHEETDKDKISVSINGSSCLPKQDADGETTIHESPQFNFDPDYEDDVDVFEDLEEVDSIESDDDEPEDREQKPTTTEARKQHARITFSPHRSENVENDPIRKLLSQIHPDVLNYNDKNMKLWARLAVASMESVVKCGELSSRKVRLTSRGILVNHRGIPLVDLLIDAVKAERRRSRFRGDRRRPKEEDEIGRRRLSDRVDFGGTNRDYGRTRTLPREAQFRR